MTKRATGSEEVGVRGRCREERSCRRAGVRLVSLGDRRTSCYNGPVGSAAGAVKDTVNAVPKLIGALFDPSTYLRIGKGALGGVFIIAGTGALVFIVANKITDGGATKAVEAAALA